MVEAVRRGAFQIRASASISPISLALVLLLNFNVYLLISTTQFEGSSSAAQRRLLGTLLTIYLPPMSERALSLVDEMLLCERTPTPIDALELPRISRKVCAGSLFHLFSNRNRLLCGEAILRCFESMRLSMLRTR